jgi:hypothetical protein
MSEVYPAWGIVFVVVSGSLASVESGISGFTPSHASAPAKASNAAARKEADHPNCWASHGVSVVVTAPPTCAPVFMIEETTPAFLPPISAVTDQYELWDM